MTNFEETTLSFSKLELANIISDTCFAIEIEDYQFTGANATSFNNIRNDLLSYLQNDSYNYVFYYYRYDSSYPGVSPNVLEITFGTTAFTGGNYRDYVIHFQTGSTDYFYLSSSSRTGSPSKNGDISSVGRGKYYFANGTIYKSTQNVQDIAIYLNYINQISGSLNVNVGDNTIMAYNAHFERSTNIVKLGELLNTQYYSSFTSYMESFSPNGWQDSSSSIFTSYSGVDEVFVNTGRLYYNLLYRIYFIGDGFQTDTYYYIFSPVGHNVTSGDIYGSGDGNNLIPILNAIDDISNYNSGDFATNIDSILNFNISGDSGDFFGITYNNYDFGGLGSYVLRFFRRLIGILTNYQDITMNFGVLGDINSISFVIPNTTLRTFVSFISNTIIVIGVIFFFARLYRKISTLDLDSLTGDNIDSLLNWF